MACVYALPGAVSGRWREPAGVLPTVYPRRRGGGCRGGGVVAGAGVARSVAIESGDRPRNNACTSDPLWDDLEPIMSRSLSCKILRSKCVCGCISGVSDCRGVAGTDADTISTPVRFTGDIGRSLATL